MNVRQATKLVQKMQRDAEKSGDFEASATTILRREGWGDASEAMATALAWGTETSDMAKFLCGIGVYEFLQQVDHDIRDAIAADLIEGWLVTRS